MNEIEKLYENAGLSNMWVEEYDDKQIWHKSYNKMVESMMKINDWSRKVAIEVAKKECRKASPPFTAEKQLELIKWLAKRPLTLLIGRYKGKYYFGNSNFNSKADSFDNALAIRINDLWQDITEEEKEQVRNILKWQQN